MATAVGAVVLLGATLGVAGSSGAAGATLDVVAAIETDGTPTFDVGAPPPPDDGGAGLDSGANNGVVKTGDTVLYRIDWSSNDAPSTNLTITATFDNGMSWTGIPAGCKTDAVGQSYISADGLTLTCLLGDVAGGQSGKVIAQGLMGAVPNASMHQMTAVVSAQGVPSATAPPVPVMASAGPKGNLTMNFLMNQMAHSVVGPGGVPGRIVYYPVGLEIGGDGKGAEPLQPQDLHFTIDMSALPSSATYAGPYPASDPDYINTAPCGPNTFRMYGQPYGAIGIVPGADAANSTVDSGTWTCTWDALTKTVSVTVAGANLAPSSFPFKDGLGQPMDFTHKFILSGVVGMWISDADLIAKLPGGTAPGTATLSPSTAHWVTGGEPIGVSGNPIVENEWDNSYSPTFHYEVPGNFDSFYTDDIGMLHADVGEGLFDAVQLVPRPPGLPSYHYFVPTQTMDDNVGDGTVTDGYQYSYTAKVSANVDTHQSAALCIQIGPNQHAIPADYLYMDYDAVGNRPAFEAGIPPLTTPMSQTSPVIATATAFSNMTEFNSDPGPSTLTMTIEYSTDTPSMDGMCNDQYTWTTTLPADLTTIHQVRIVSDRALQLNEQISAVVALQADAAPTGTHIGSVGSYNQWDPITSSLQLSPWHTLTSDRFGAPTYNVDTTCKPLFPDYAFNDCLTMVAGDVAIDKSVVGQSRDLVSGDTVDYSLTAQILGGTSASTDNVTVTDTLPLGITYVTGSASIPPTSIALNGSGQQTLTWDLGTQQNGTTTTITYSGLLGAGIGPFTQLSNEATLTGTVDTGEGTEALGPKSASATVQTAGPFSRLDVFKSTSTPLRHVDEPMSFTLTYTNTGTEALTPALDTIDVLPYVGDGRDTPSAFSGTLSLTNIVPNQPDAKKYVTNADPATVVIDPADSTNDFGTGATLWCEVAPSDPLIPDMGDAGCPATLGEATAVRVVFARGLAIGNEANIRLDLTPVGNAGGDVYTNDFGARIASLKLPVRSNEAVVRVIEAKLGDVVWRDLNSNGVQDAGEPGVPGVLVTVYDTGGNPVGTATTDANGKWSVTVDPGTYTVGFSNLPPGLVFSVANLGGDDATDSDPNALGRTGPYTVGVNETNLTIDAGLVYPVIPPNEVTTTLAPTTTAPSTSTTSPTDTVEPATTTTIHDSSGTATTTTEVRGLPATGGDSSGILWVAALAVIMGSLVLLSLRRPV